MFGMTAFDPSSASIRQSSYLLGLQDRADLSRVTSELIHCYQGNQLGYLWDYLGRLMKNLDLLEVYRRLAVYHNIVRFLVDRMSTVGKFPVHVIASKPDGTRDTDAQALWDEIATWRLGESGWDAFIPSLDRRKELCKTVVACVGWDEREQEITVDSYTANTCSVEYDGSKRIGRPDRFRLLRGEEHDYWQVWDFTNREEGPTGRVYETDITGKSNPDAGEPVPVIDPETGRSIVPFVTFRTDEPTDSFFIWDGQAELLAAQQFINRCYTQLSVLLHFGTFKVGILSGGGWKDKDGNAPRLTPDISQFLCEPEDPFGTTHSGPKIRWDGPATETLIDSMIRAIDHCLVRTAAANGIDPKAITVSNEPASGYALQISDEALRDKHEKSRRHIIVPLHRLVRVIRLVWDHHNPARRFPADTVFTIDIPNYGSGLTPRDEVEGDIAKLREGIVSRRSLIYKHNPGISAEEVQALVARAEDGAIEISDPVLVVQAVSAGILSKDEARALFGLEGPAPSPEGASDSSSIDSAGPADSKPVNPTTDQPAPPAQENTNEQRPET